MDQCASCHRPMRPYGASVEDYPGGITRGTNALCITCYKHRGGPKAAAPPAAADDTPCVLVRADLRISTYRAFDVAARERGVTVGKLLSELADQVVRTRPAPRRKPFAKVPRPPRAPRTPGPAGEPRDDIDRKIIELNSDGLSDSEIARLIGMSQPGVFRRRVRLGLLSPFGGGSRKAG